MWEWPAVQNFLYSRSWSQEKIAVKTPRKRHQKCWRVVLQKNPSGHKWQEAFWAPKQGNHSLLLCAVETAMHCGKCDWMGNSPTTMVCTDECSAYKRTRKVMNLWSLSASWQKYEWPGNGKNQKREFRICNFISKLRIRNWFFPSIWWAGQSVMKLGISRWFLQSAHAMTISNALTK